MTATKTEKTTKFAEGTKVKVVNWRSPSYGRTGLVTNTGRLKASIRFSDLPQISEAELADPTGLKAAFFHHELEEIPEKQPQPEVSQELLDQLQDLLAALCLDLEMGIGGAWENPDDTLRCNVDQIRDFYSQWFGDISQHPVYPVQVEGQ